MDITRFIQELTNILEEVPTGILSTCDKEGNPHSRWMTPSFLPGRGFNLFAITSPHSQKIQHLKENPSVEWIIQTKALDKIITIRGKINLLENPSIIREVQEKIGKKLKTFWTINHELDSLVVMETIPQTGELFIPMKGIREKVSFE